MNIKESDLYKPVSEYLERLGYEVKGEVKDCDIVAVAGDEMVVVELKKSFSVELLFQAMERQKAADSVYAAVPMPNGGYRGKRYKNMVYLCKRLEIGLILVGFSANGTPMVDVAVHPEPRAAVRKAAKKRAAILKEHGARTGSNNRGGVTRTKILTAYKEELLRIAWLLEQNGELTTRELREHGASDKTSAMVNRDYYKWFKKTDGQKYALSENGKAALEEYSGILEDLMRDNKHGCDGDENTVQK